jgi:hypothetical protein
MLRDIFFKTMKSIKSSLVLCTLLALAGMTSSYAAVATPGNLVIGFRAVEGTGTNSNVLIDLGAASDITTITRNTYNLSGVNSILSSTYGANWSSREDLFYGIISYNGYLTADESDIYQDFWSTRLNNSGALAPDAFAVYAAQPTFGAFALNNPDNALSSGFVAGTDSAGGALTSQYLVIDNRDANSWGTLSGEGWGYIFPESQDNLVTSFSSLGNALGIYRSAGLTGDFQQSIGAAVYLDSGSLVVVPEPSTYMLLVLSVAVLFFAIRRRKA